MGGGRGGGEAAGAEGGGGAPRAGREAGEASGEAVPGAGASGLASGHRGKVPNNALGEEVRKAALSAVRERHRDFGPTLAAEKLAEAHGLPLSRETLRKWMIEDGLWRPMGRRKARVHQSRPRRPRVGELVQVDGSPHDWFEGRGPRRALIAFVDDATSRLTALRFFEAETTRACMETLGAHLESHGRPWRCTRTATACSA